MNFTNTQFSLNSILFPNKHLYIATHICTNIWEYGLENKILRAPRTGGPTPGAYQNQLRAPLISQGPSVQSKIRFVCV